MDRLTEWTGKRWIAVQEKLNGKTIGDKDIYAKLAHYEDTSLTPAELAELAQGKKDGLVVVLPCKLGTKVYEAICKKDNRDCHYVLNYTFSWNTYTAVTESLHKGTLFYTRKEAENYIRKQGLLTPSKSLRALDRMKERG